MSKSTMHDGRITVERLRAGDPALADIWQTIQSQGGVESPFLTWEWFASLAEIPSVSTGVHVLLAKAGREPLGIFPLEWTTGPGRLRTVGCAAWRWLTPDHLDIVAGEHRAAAATGIVRHLASRRDWDLLDLRGLVRDGALAQAVERELRAPRFFRRAELESCPFVPLRGRGELELLPSQNLRKTVRRDVRSAESEGGGFSVVTDPDLLATLLERMMQLHNERFGDASSVFATADRRRFHLLVARRMAEAGMARMYRLTGETDAALLYAFVLGDRVFAYSQGIVPGIWRSPGITVEARAILGAAAEGFGEYDMLRGVYDAKERFPVQMRSDLRLAVLRTTQAAFTEAARGLARRAGRAISQRPGSHAATKG